MSNWESTGNKSDSISITTEGESAIKEYTIADLWVQAWSLAGKSLFYMQFLHSEIDWRGQKKRVERMCYHLACEWRNHFKDTPENRKWFADWIRAFEDEVENQC